MVAPVTGAPLVVRPLSVESDLDAAMVTLRAGQRAWAATPLEERARVFLRFHDLVYASRDQGLDIVQWETGKARRDAMEELVATDHAQHPDQGVAVTYGSSGNVLAQISQGLLAIKLAQLRVLVGQPRGDAHAHWDGAQVHHQVGVELLGDGRYLSSRHGAAKQHLHHVAHGRLSGRRAAQLEARVGRVGEVAQDKAALVADQVVQALVARRLVLDEVGRHGAAGYLDPGQGRQVGVLDESGRVARLAFDEAQELMGHWLQGQDG